MIKRTTKKLIEKDIRKKLVFFILSSLLFLYILCVFLYYLKYILLLTGWVSETIDSMQTIENCRCYSRHLCAFSLLHLRSYSDKNLSERLLSWCIYTNRIIIWLSPNQQRLTSELFLSFTHREYEYIMKKHRSILNSCISIFLCFFCDFSTKVRYMKLTS